MGECSSSTSVRHRPAQGPAAVPRGPLQRHEEREGREEDQEAAEEPWELHHRRLEEGDRQQGVHGEYSG